MKNNLFYLRLEYIIVSDRNYHQARSLPAQLNLLPPRPPPGRTNSINPLFFKVEKLLKIKSLIINLKNDKKFNNTATPTPPQFFKLLLKKNNFIDF